MNDAEDRDAGDIEDEAFLDRWSRRKMSVDREKIVTETGVVDPRQELTDADMPAIDSLDGDSDYSVFMSPKVSEQLRTQALHKLFHLPAFNVTDGLNDYDEDYTQFTGLGNVITHEMKRMLRRELEAATVPDTPPDTVAATEAPVGPADEELIEEMDEDDKDEHHD